MPNMISLKLLWNFTEITLLHGCSPVILKPDKENGIVLLNHEDYIKSIETLFSSKIEFKELDSDPTLI